MDPWLLVSVMTGMKTKLRNVAPLSTNVKVFALTICVEYIYVYDDYV